MDTVEEATPDTVRTDMERIKPMSSIHVLLFQAQLEPVESGRSDSHNDVPHVSIKHELSTKMTLKAVILDGRSLTRQGMHSLILFMDGAHIRNRFKLVKSFRRHIKRQTVETKE
jgi:hypothetical protein